MEVRRPKLGLPELIVVAKEQVMLCVFFVCYKYSMGSFDYDMYLLR